VHADLDSRFFAKLTRESFAWYFTELEASSRKVGDDTGGDLRIGQEDLALFYEDPVNGYSKFA
jgi:hypothetical protein